MSDDVVSVSMIVAALPAEAYRIFVDDIDRWWNRRARGRLSTGRTGTLTFEPRLGGRFIEALPDGSEREIGRISVWSPPTRLVFSWLDPSFAPGQETTVEVLFEPDGQQGCRLLLEHRGWDRFPADHPFRRGMHGQAFVSMIGLWWADGLNGLKNRAGRTTR